MMKHAARWSLRLNLVAVRLSPLVLLVAVGGGALTSDSQQLRGAPAGTSVDNAVIQRSLGELAIARSAHQQAKDAAEASRTQQQNYLSHVGVQKAAKDYEKIEAMVPEARAAVLEARQYAAKARQYADHTLQVEEASRHIPDVAAERSKEAVEGWIRSEAAQAAEASALSPKEAAKAKQDKLAAKVAAAAEPYHLALLRNQKFAAETYNKAQTAQQSSKQLQMNARKIALSAQELQASGLGLDAQSTMAQAHAMMQEAESMRQWATKLYKQANTADSTAGGYTLSEQQAATNAAATTIVNAPMRLPPASM